MKSNEGPKLTCNQLKVRGQLFYRKRILDSHNKVFMNNLKNTITKIKY